MVGHPALFPAFCPPAALSENAMRPTAAGVVLWAPFADELIEAIQKAPGA